MSTNNSIRERALDIDTGLHETLMAIGRSPETFQRDTPQLLQILDNLEEMNRRVKDIGRNPDRRIK